MIKTERYYSEQSSMASKCSQRHCIGYFETAALPDADKVIEPGESDVQQRVKRAESLREAPAESVRANSAEMPVPLILPANVPVAPRENVMFIAS